MVGHTTETQSIITTTAVIIIIIITNKRNIKRVFDAFSFVHNLSLSSLQPPQ